MATKELKSWRKVKVTLVREASPEGYQVRSGADIARMVRGFIGDDPREWFVAVYLDTANRPVAIHQVSIGTVDTTLVGPREVFCPAVALAATSIVVAHNHPSGDPTPSPNDRAVTDRLRAAGEILGVELLDHVVLGTQRYFSFAAEAFYSYPA